MAGAASGSITRLICQPLDVAKIRLQLQAESGEARKYRSLCQLLLKLPREEGLTALWKGHVPAQLLSVTYGFASFAVFEGLAARFNNEYLQENPHSRAVVHSLCGSVGGCAGTLLSFPFDMLRTRLVAQSSPVYTGSLHASRLLYSEAGLTTFYRGFTVACLAVAPQSGLQFGLYPLFTHLLGDLVTKTDLTLGEEMITLQGSLVCGALAGVATKTILYPLDVVKKRLQVSGWEEGRRGLGLTPKYSSLRDCVLCIVRQEGPRALYKGYTPALVKAASTSSIHFMSYEWVCKAFLLKKKLGATSL